MVSCVIVAEDYLIGAGFEMETVVHPLWVSPQETCSQMNGELATIGITYSCPEHAIAFVIADRRTTSQLAQRRNSHKDVQDLLKYPMYLWVKHSYAALARGSCAAANMS